MKPSEIFEGENSSLRKTFDSIASSPQPEEWSVRFEQLFEENTIIDYDHPVSGLKCDRETRYVFIDFIKTEIRKAEERGKEFTREALKPFVYDRPIQDLIDASYKKGIQDLAIPARERWQEEKIKFIQEVLQATNYCNTVHEVKVLLEKDLEALKK